MGEFEVTAINLVEGFEYDLFWSTDLIDFFPISNPMTADASGILIFVDPFADPINDLEFYYRVELVPGP